MLKASTGQHFDLTGKAWETTATLTLTGEAAAYAGLKAKAAFDPAKGQWGAFEAVARVNGLEIGREAVTSGLVDPTKSVRTAFAWGIGLNWYLNRNVKQMVDYERTSFTGGGAAGADRPAENAIFLRSQVSF